MDEIPEDAEPVGEYVAVPAAEWEQVLLDLSLLDALFEAGVEDWEGFDEAFFSIQDEIGSVH